MNTITERPLLSPEERTSLKEGAETIREFVDTSGLPVRYVPGQEMISPHRRVREIMGEMTLDTEDIRRLRKDAGNLLWRDDQPHIGIKIKVFPTNSTFPDGVWVGFFDSRDPRSEIFPMFQSSAIAVLPNGDVKANPAIYQPNHLEHQNRATAVMAITARAVQERRITPHQ